MVMRNPGYGPLPVPAIPNQASVNPRLVSTSQTPDQGGPNYRWGGLLTYEKPITEWYGDIVCPPGQSTVLRAGVELPNNCVNVRFIAVAGTPTVNINGQGARTILNLDGYDNTEIQSLILNLGAADTVTVQAGGTGD